MSLPHLSASLSHARALSIYLYLSHIRVSHSRAIYPSVSLTHSRARSQAHNSAAEVVKAVPKVKTQLAEASVINTLFKTFLKVCLALSHSAYSGTCAQALLPLHGGYDILSLYTADTRTSP